MRLPSTYTMCVCVIYIKEFAHEIGEAGNRVGATQAGLMCYFFLPVLLRYNLTYSIV